MKVMLPRDFVCGWAELYGTSKGAGFDTLKDTLHDVWRKMDEEQRFKREEMYNDILYQLTLFVADPYPLGHVREMISDDNRWILQDYGHRAIALLFVAGVLGNMTDYEKNGKEQVINILNYEYLHLVPGCSDETIEWAFHNLPENSFTAEDFRYSPRSLEDMAVIEDYSHGYYQETTCDFESSIMREMCMTYRERKDRLAMLSILRGAWERALRDSQPCHSTEEDFQRMEAEIKAASEEGTAPEEQAVVAAAMTAEEIMENIACSEATEWQKKRFLSLIKGKSGKEARTIVEAAKKVKVIKRKPKWGKERNTREAEALGIKGSRQAFQSDHLQIRQYDLTKYINLLKERDGEVAF